MSDPVASLQLYAWLGNRFAISTASTVAIFRKILEDQQVSHRVTELYYLAQDVVTSHTLPLPRRSNPSAGQVNRPSLPSALLVAAEQLGGVLPVRNGDVKNVD